MFMAEQSQPLRRRLALKIIKPGFDTLAVIARFEAERQALAMMDHPNIARVYDAGATESGRPYFVMELVRGATITDCCRDRNVSLRDRLKLFIEVCDAVQHAHQKGIIHRDLKPTNILVTQTDTALMPKVIDFGIAKATNPLTDRTLFTAFTQIVGTPLYMSPEQADLGNQDVDTRSDVYSLGVVLYELLTGTTPFDAERLRSAGHDEMRRIIREEEPPKPSTRATTIASATTQAHSVADFRSIPAVALKGDLDWIVMKALEKDRRLRYESPSELAADIRRHLSHEPIVARPGGALHKLSKWTRRHVAAVWTALAASLGSAILLGASTLLVAASRDAENAARLSATQERDRAIDQRQAAVDESNRARRNQYIAEIVSSQTDLAEGNLPRLHEKLARHLPLSEQPDHRGWEWYYLFSASHPEESAFYCPAYALYAAWSPNGEHIASSGAIWKAESGECIRLLHPSTSDMRECAWSPDGNSVAWSTLSQEGIWIWSRQTDEFRRLTGGHASSVWPVEFSPDGQQLATGSIDETVKIWNVATGTVVRTIPSLNGNITDVAWSPDGELLAVGVAWDGRVRIYSAATGELKHSHAIPDGPARIRLSWRPDGRELAVNSSNSWFILGAGSWAAKGVHKHLYDTSSDGVDIQWNADGSLLAYSERSNVVVWDPVADAAVKHLAGHLAPVQSISWHPDGEKLLSTDGNREVRIWDVNAKVGPPTVKIEEPLQRVTWDEDGSTLLTVRSSALGIQRWNAIKGTLESSTTNAVAADGQHALLSPDMKLVAYAVARTDGEEIRVHDAQSGAALSVYVADAGFKSMVMTRPEKSFNWDPGAMAWSPDAGRLAIPIYSADQVGFDVWDVRGERRIARWTHKRHGALTGDADVGMGPIVWSPNGTQIAAEGIGDGGELSFATHLHVIDAESGRRILKYAFATSRRNGGNISVHAWSRDSRYLAFGTFEGYVEIVDVQSGQRRMTCKAHDAPVTALEWSPDASRLASAAANGVVKIIETIGGSDLLTLRAPDAGVRLLAWSPDGRRIAAASEHQLRIWDASEGFAFADSGARRSELAWLYNKIALETPSLRTQALQQSLLFAPKQLGYRVLRGNALARLSRFDEAAREFRAAWGAKLEHGLLFADLQLHAHLGARDLDAYRDLLNDFVPAMERTDIDYNRDEAYWLACLIPDSGIDLTNYIEEQHEAIKAAPDSFDAQLVNICAAGLYRQERFAECAQVLASSSDQSDRLSSREQYSTAINKLILAMVRSKLGHREQAARLLQEAIRLQEQLTADPDVDWKRLVEVVALRRQAEALIEL